MAAAYDLHSGRVTGSPFRVAEDLDAGAEFAVSKTGTLVLAPTRSGFDLSALVWVDRQGREAIRAPVNWSRELR